jgi:isopentenyldiphosphate isomerase
MTTTVDPYPQQLIDDLQNGSVIPFIGSGLSSASGMVGWDAITSKIAGELKKRGLGDLSGGLLPGKRYFLDVAEIYNIAYRNKYPLSRILKNHFDGDFSPNELHDIVLRFNFDIILTTNFDRLIEKALDHHKMSFNLVCEDGHLKYFDEKTKTQVVKIHGTIENPESMVFSLSTYDDYAQKRSLIYTFLTGLFATKTILFIGFGLRDPNVEKLLKKLQGDRGDSFRDHYALVFEPDRDTVGRLSDVGIRCVTASGSDIQQATKGALETIFELGSATASRNLDRATMINRTFGSMLDTLPAGACVRMRASLGMTSNPKLRLARSTIYGGEEQDNAEIEMGNLLRRFLGKNRANRYRGIVHVNAAQQLGKGFGREAFRARLLAMKEFMEEYPGQIEIVHSPVPAWMNHLILHDRASFLSHKGGSLAGYEKTRRTHIRSIIMSEIHTFDSDFWPIEQDNRKLACELGIDVAKREWLGDLMMVVASRQIAQLDRVPNVLCCDRDGRVTGREPRDKAHASGQLHRSVHLHLVDLSGPSLRVLLQRRGLAKDLYPGKVDVGVAGHQETDSAEEDAMREASEELGIWMAKGQLRHMFDYPRRIADDNEYIAVFVAEWSSPADTIARRYADEIQELYWVQVDDLHGTEEIPAQGFRKVSSMVYEVNTLIDRRDIVEGTVEEIQRVSEIIRDGGAG